MFSYMAGIYEDGAGMNNYPEGMTRQDYEYLSGAHCPMCERDDEGESCDDEAAHDICGHHYQQARDDYLLDQAGL